jgi:hypothetical protein
VTFIANYPKWRLISRSPRRSRRRSWWASMTSCRGLISAFTALAVALGMLSACGGAGSRSVSYGRYVGQLCEALGPFVRDAQRLGRRLAAVGIDEKSQRSELALGEFLTTAVVDSHSAITRLETIGIPEIGDGGARAAEVVAKFSTIEQIDAMWLTELRTHHKVWPPSPKVGAERSRTSLGALVLVGHEFERLPRTPERQNAMARSPVCRDVFGSVRVSG